MNIERQLNLPNVLFTISSFISAITMSSPLRSFMYFTQGRQRIGTNKATFVQFNPPHKLINNPMVLQQHHHVLTHRRVKKAQPFQLTSGFAPLPTCIRAKSVDSSVNSPMEDLYRAFSSHLDFSHSDEECTKKDSKQCEIIPNQNNKVKLSPSIMSLISQPKLLVDDINIEEIMNYRSIYKKGSGHFQKKSSMSGDPATRLLQPKPNIPMTQSKSFHSLTQNSWSTNKPLKSTRKVSKTRLQTDLETLGSSKPPAKTYSNLGEPLRSSEGRKIQGGFSNVKRSQPLSSLSKGFPFSSIVIPEGASNSLRLTNRPQSHSDNVRLLYDNIDSQDDACARALVESNISTPETSEVEKNQKKRINFLLSKPLKKLTKSKVDKIEIYEPKVALYFAKGCKTET